MLARECTLDQAAAIAATGDVNIAAIAPGMAAALLATVAGLGRSYSQRCIGCHACTVACKSEHDVPLGVNRTWLKYIESGEFPNTGRSFSVMRCNHCDDAPCMKAAKNGAVRKRPDGIVIIDPEKSRGQKKIVAACPYNVIFWNEEKDIPQAWPFDAHLLDEGWTRTRAEQACPMNVFRTICVDDARMQRIQAEEDLEVLRPAVQHLDDGGIGQQATQRLQRDFRQRIDQPGAFAVRDLHQPQGRPVGAFTDELGVDSEHLAV